jgi:hypothetical protein
MKWDEFRPVAGFGASILFVETLQLANRNFAARNATDSRLQEARGHVVIAVKLDVIEGGGDAKPAGHRRGFVTQDVRARGQYHVAVTHWTADENNFQFNESSGIKLPGAQKINSRRADVSRDERYGKFLGHIVHTAQAQGQPECGARIFALLGVNTNGMCGNSGESPRLRVGSQRHRLQNRQNREHSWSGNRFRRGDYDRTRARNWPLCVVDQRLCGVPRLHLALRDAATRAIDTKGSQVPIEFLLEPTTPNSAEWVAKMPFEHLCRQPVENARSVLT